VKTQSSREATLVLEKKKKPQVVPYLLRSSIILSGSAKKIGITLNVPKPQYTAFFENFRAT
jgi:hypothetical protein